MPSLSVVHRVLVFDNDTVSAKVLKALLGTKPSVGDVRIITGLSEATEAFRSNFNCMFIDIFSIGVRTGTEAIEYTRRAFPSVPICLFATQQQLSEMDGVDQNWRVRFSHYYRLPKDYSLPDFDRELDDVLDKFGNYLERETARRQVDTLVEISNSTNFTDEQKKQIEEIAKSVKLVLQPPQENRPAKPAKIVPGVDTSRVEELVNVTLKDATQSLRLTTSVNIGVLVTGSVLVFVAFIVASITGSWEAVAFGGFGIAGIVASLIANPLKSIGISARRLVQLQIAYLTFVSQLAMLNEDSKKATPIERSQRMGDEMARTLKVLEDSFGK